jgi:large subunit ribosomal protein L11
MAKKIVAVVKLLLKAGQATAAPPVGTVLGPKGINLGLFVKDFNSKTTKDTGKMLPTVVTIYADKSFTFITKVPPVSYLIKDIIKMETASKTPGKSIVANITNEQVESIAKLKMPDLNCFGELDAAKKMVVGAARSMGVAVKG